MNLQLASPIPEPAAESAKQYIASIKWYAEEKLDGDRFSLTIDGETLRAFGRSGMELHVPPSLANVRLPPEIQRTVLDGELVNDTYFVFDLLEFHGSDYTSISYALRRTSLERVMDRISIPSCELVYCAKTPDEKQTLVDYAMAERKEGVVFKRVDAPYVEGRNRNWLKYKFYKTCDCIVTQLEREGKPEAVELSLIDGDGNIHDVGGCKVPSRYQQEQDIGVGDVIEVRYLDFTSDRRLYQPVFLRKRTDKSPSDCTFDQVVL